MKVSIYLHKPIVETLLCYGSLEDVTNRILDACESGEIDIMDRPKVPPRDGAGRYDVDIRSDYYMELLDTFSPTSPRISLRRLLYWFVENEMYDVLGWEPTYEYIDNEKRRILKMIQDVNGKLTRFKRYLNEGELIWANIVLENLNILKETVNDGR